MPFHERSKRIGVAGPDLPDHGYVADFHSLSLDGQGGRRLVGNASVRAPVSMYNMACAYSRLNQKDEAIAWLERSQAAGFHLKDYIHQDDDLDNLRSDPRFRRLREQHKNAKSKNWEWHWNDDDDGN